MTIIQPEVTVATALDGVSGHPYGTLGTNLYASASGEVSEDASPTPSTHVRSYGGPPPSMYLSPSRRSWNEVYVQIIFRGLMDTSAATLDLARAARDYLCGVTLAGYTFCLPQQPDPVDIRRTPTDLPRYAVNFRLGVKRTTS